MECVFVRVCARVSEVQSYVSKGEVFLKWCINQGIRESGYQGNEVT
jgi:hypothetical protein